MNNGTSLYTKASEQRIAILANRLPISITRKDGKLKFLPSSGGVATGLSSLAKDFRSFWIGWPGITSEKMSPDERKTISEELLRQACHPVFLSQREVENYYHGFCNKTIWPLFHYFTQYTKYSEPLWESYKQVNEVFCEAAVELLQPDDIIWIHDYQLMLLPDLLRTRFPDATIGFFLHIPFPSFEVFRLLPWRDELLTGLLGSDLIGFHTYDYVVHFLDSVRRLAGYEHNLGQIVAENRQIKVDAFPMGIDYERFSSTVHLPEVQKEISKLRKKFSDRKIILSIDRLDYTKGIVERLEAFDLFLERYPEYREQVTLILVAVPSRTGVPQYMMLKRQVEELIGKINGTHGTIGWVPVWYLYRSLPFHNLVALYNISDIALVTPMRDGMNLIAKEFIATKTDSTGVLILSEMAGAVKELGEAITINPNNKEEIADAIKEALTISPEEQVERNQIMQQRLQRYDVTRWAYEFVERIHLIKHDQQQSRTKQLSEKAKHKLIGAYAAGTKRLLLLDYDGSLVPYEDYPLKARPDEKVLELLESLTGNSKNEVMLISGRDKITLETWFGEIDIGLIAEHGVWIRERGKNWKTIEPLKNDWKKKVGPILELYVDRTPGSFIEEKHFSIAWHYRKADTELGVVRSNELKNILFHLTTKLKLEVMEGDKVIEVKNVGINKGTAVRRWLSKKDWNFILSIGDDLTDEEVFSILPKSAYSIKVGLSTSQASFNVGSYVEIRELLAELVKK